METVNELVNQINETRTQKSACYKDETRVMAAMLNDPTYKVDVYGKSGVEGSYCPYEESRLMISNIIKDTTKISSKESAELANNYEFTKQTSNIMIGLSKEYINTYLKTGRKMNLGGREDSNISIIRKVKESRDAVPRKIGVNDDGTDKMAEGSGTIPAHGSIKVYSPCPTWLK